MKKMFFLVLTFVLGKSILALTYVPEERDLLNLANEKLQTLANESGHVLEEDATSFSSALGTKAIQLTSGFGAGAVAGAVGFASIHVVAGAAAGPGGAALSVGLSALAVGIAGAYVLVNPVASEATLDPYARYRAVHHYRMKLNYRLKNDGGFPRGRGSCIFFFAVDVNEEETEAVVSIEIDECTHANIFPEYERGNLRIGEDGEDWWDEQMGQINVVATDSYTVPMAQALRN